MSVQYKLTCRCGQSYPVNTSQAGRTIDCTCGETLNVPSMLKIKKLPVWEESAPIGSAAGGSAVGGLAAGGSAVDVRTGESVKNQKERKTRLSGRFGILLFGLLAMLIFGFLFVRQFLCYPIPTQVFQKQREFINDGNVVRRDSTPIELSDFYFYVNDDIIPGTWAEVNSWLIARMTPYTAYTYFEYLSNGPRLSDNFYENYDTLKIQYWLKTGLFGALFLLAFLIPILAWLWPKKKTVVGVMRGSQWRT